MGWDTELEPDTAAQLIQRIGADFQPPRFGPISTSSANAATLPTPPANDAQQSTGPNPEASVHGTLKDMGFIVPDPKSLTLDLAQFRQDFRKSFKPYHNAPPRGSFFVKGRIDVCGDRGRLTIDILAVFDPKQNRFVSFPLFTPYMYTPNRQVPRGGP